MVELEVICAVYERVDEVDGLVLREDGMVRAMGGMDFGRLHGRELSLWVEAGCFQSY